MNSNPKRGGASAHEINCKVAGEGSAFHNPYTFLPFAEDGPAAAEPSLLTIDEAAGEGGRFTGVIELEVKTLSPLLSADPVPQDERAVHKEYAALKIGPDVIVPATGVRGMLRSLLTVLTGGVLSTLDSQAYLCQGRDAKLGPRGKSGGAGVPVSVFLGRVVEPGNRYRPGRVEMGETELIPMEELERLLGDLDRLRPTGKVPEGRIYIDNPGRPMKHGAGSGPATPWEVRLSGRPVNIKGKREGAFKGNGNEIELPPELWVAYTNRHRHGVRPEMKKGDLVWLEPTKPDLAAITSAGQIKSLQWARWGRSGQSFLSSVPAGVLPDYMDPKGLVDEVTDLFGLVSPERETEISPFAGRVRSENLVFLDAADKVQKVTLAPLAPPHPGCVAFYRAGALAGRPVPKTAPLRGYKVYRTTEDRGEQAPWHFATQGTYGEKGELNDPRQKVNKTVELVPEGSVGTLRIAVRGLSGRELGLVLQACHVPWRLGGGKPLGLGLCQVSKVRLWDEAGGEVDLAGLRWQENIADLGPRVHLWVQSQKPVGRLRYPRAVERNNRKISRGGHVWFQRHASLRKTEERGEVEAKNFEFQGRRLSGGAAAAAGSGELPVQMLPEFDPADPLADVLYGYDLLARYGDERDNQARFITGLEAFDPVRHLSGTEQSGGNTSQNRQSRQDERAGRVAPVPAAAPPPLKAGDMVEAVLLAEKTKSGGWRARHESGLEGPIQNSPAVPAEKKAGDKLGLIVASAKPGQAAFKYPTDAEKARAQKPAPKTQRPFYRR